MYKIRVGNVIYLGLSKKVKGKRSLYLKFCVLMSFHISYVKDGIENLFHGCGRTSYDVSKFSHSAPTVKKILSFLYEIHVVVIANPCHHKRGIL